MATNQEFQAVADKAASHEYIYGFHGATLGIRFFNEKGEELAYKFYGLMPVVFVVPRKQSKELTTIS